MIPIACLGQHDQAAVVLTIVAALPDNFASGLAHTQPVSDVDGCNRAAASG